MATEDTDFDYESALGGCARGEAFALESLYRRESKWLGGVAFRILRDRALAEEALHDAFLQIWQKAHTFDRNLGSGRGWIYTVVRHRALGMVRTQGREVTVDDVAALADARCEPVSLQDGRDDAADIDKCLEGLAPERRESILLAFLDGYSHEQIARTLATPLGTVKSWIKRGLASLKECLS
jgi:RNA polymerase sigma-70 factor (ECF subfamily)